MVSPGKIFGCMSLGQLITILKRKDKQTPIYFDFDGWRPKGLTSYRGYYEDLALTYGRDDISIDQLLNRCERAMGEEFYGYKGGNYRAGADTHIWVADWGSAFGTGLVGVKDDDYRIVLETKCVDG